jgi:uncharacterized membrane protein
MAFIEKSIEVEQPVRTVYDQWTQFEQFPRFMEGVEEVRQLDDTRLLWRAKIGGKTEQWEAEIVEQRPDERIRWTSTRGAMTAGLVTFNKVSNGRTRVTLRMDYDPQGFVEKAGDMLGFVTRRVEGDLKRFKSFIEERGAATGEWRGTVDPHAPGHL